MMLVGNKKLSKEETLFFSNGDWGLGLTFDPKFKCGYIKFFPLSGKYDGTKELEAFNNAQLFFDVDKDNNLLGIEVLWSRKKDMKKKASL